jgi:NAD(P)-dependent dehydrogenase (short-subunit alcohol dehydrogenase family)
MRVSPHPDQAKDFKLMNVQDSVALVTGSGRGLGRQFAAQLLKRGAKKVYATARDPERVQIPGVTPRRLDITDPDSVARAAAIAGGVRRCDRAAIREDAPGPPPAG